ncbi:chymotrypsin-1-like [Copidosoma floridanum]|uniref:chymotrypsin-1-like n=1 Tax=Copidosoma floridanum TaxID=29053 RepID=UPI0006C9D66E|nr:chymotrypsin-1-like [Copidosoma floridanum]
MKSYLALLFIGFLSTSYVEAVSRISGGSDAPIDKFPFSAFLKDNLGFLCGATIIHKNYVLTAASCVYQLASPRNVEVVVGTINSTGDGGDHYPAKRIIVHEQHKRVDGLYSKNDIALVEVSGDIKFNDKVQPIKLPSESAVFIPENTTVILSGYGQTEKYSNNQPDTLHFVKNEIKDYTICALTWLSVRFIVLNKGQICTKAPRGVGACIGDSGSPLVNEDGVQVGIVSFGMPCGNGYPDVYTNVAYYAKWINSKISTPSGTL